MLLRPALAVVAVALLVAGCGSDGGSDDKDTSAASETTTCSYPSDGQSPAKEVDPPDEKAPASGTVRADMKTSIGDLGLDLDAAAAPCTVNSFVSLAEQGYFDDTSCHRLTNESIYVLQCGDPTGTGTGGPGYTIPLEVSGDETYPAGTLAMARAQDPDSGGSQFFIVYADSGLPAEYTVFGTVDDVGVKAVAKVAEDGNDGSMGANGGAPNTPVDIEKVTVG
ncbi:peptidylprolyl isomerase [Nocardioides sp. T2.26MG-1]|uniref:peptidylprolyl isomerase n=1 Tax=Nocardioides sp. T2.26MG-1 TaxID=3041166 RepID=UPI002477A4A5|nr:peptidylprolyl isomerase [Nocardioides sp. T2.26MG-1]CAI9414353.1 putative peptidyl-prolyl cis-trans isomerase B [Nocardioides sp. T2.26MG-1]